jgi:hypothetical protein
MSRRPCKACGKNRAAKFFKTDAGTVCVPCQKAKRSASTHARRVEQTYGLTAEQYRALLAHQGGACAICKGVRPYRLNVDHCHATGLVRGLLCRRCNKLLRDVRDSVEVLCDAANYLVSPPARRLGIRAVAS